MMSSESRVFTVTVLTETADGIVIAHFDYQGENRANDAMTKWHTECAYARGVNTIKYFCAYISNEWGGDEMRDSYTNPSFVTPEE